MITEADLKKFAPKARKEYVAALLGGMDHLRSAGILENQYRLETSGVGVGLGYGALPEEQ